ncbi:diguanylate cyclase domain-containing protein [Chromobacterium piscinae]|uniref:GGDEF domain-containing protein n=1 Tax=Chromobacterium piscinae TaxID=686831 RepID=UPI001E305DB5|nr:diguanylate cyclase [Chromobacterium piscinae]
MHRFTLSTTELKRQLLHDRYRLLAIAASLFLVLLGTDVISGWILRTPALIPENIHMVIATAFCLILYGLALPLALWRPQWRAHRVLAALVLAMATATLLEHLSGRSLGLDLPQLHAWRNDMVPHPGRMAPPTALALAALGCGLLLQPGSTPTRRRAVKICVLLPLLLGVLGAVAYLVNLELLYSWGASVRMALLTALGVISAALGLDALRRQALRRHLRSQDMADSISVTATALLISISLTTGLLIYRVSSAAHERSLSTVMANSVRQRAALLVAQFGISDDIARRIYQRPSMQKLLEDASRGKLDASAAAAELAARNHMTLNGIAIQDGGGRALVQVGYFETRPRQALALRSPAGSRLLWNGHYLYRTEAIYRTSAGSSRLVIEQKLEMFDRIVQDTAPRDGLSGLYALCGHDDHDLRCFSQSPRDPGPTIPIAGNVRHFTMWPAFSGKSGSLHAVDYSGRDVISAYAPVGDSGLAFSYKIRVADLLAPIRHDLEIDALIMLAMVTLGTLILRWRTSPLLREVLQSNRMAEMAAERFRNAAEANMDAFIIMEALRDHIGEVDDFRVVYINAEAERMWQLRRDETIGRNWKALAASLNVSNHFESYKQVIDTGMPLSEEVPKAYDASHPIWIHQEIVRAGDGISISVRDITQKKLAELDLVLREALLKTVTDSIPALVAFVDVDQRYRYCNKTYTRLFGIAPEQVIGRNMRDFLGEESYAAVRPYVEQALQGQAAAFEMEMFLHGSQRYVEGRYIPQQHADGTVSGFYVMIWDITQSRAREIELRNKVTQDAMTGLLNRAAFMDILGDEIKHHYLKRQALALLFLDIDHFKQVNDTLGHATGDELIKIFAGRLRQNVRGTDHVARLGGDEFVVLLVGLDTERTATAVVDKLMAAVCQDAKLSGERRRVSTSIGVAYAYMPDITPERLLEIADEGLYQAKAAGRNTYRLMRVG